MLGVKSTSPLLAKGNRRLARVGLIAIAAYFGGPTLIGLLAELTSLPVAFAFPVVLYMIVGFQSKYIKVREIKK